MGAKRTLFDAQILQVFCASYRWFGPAGSDFRLLAQRVEFTLERTDCFGAGTGSFGTNTFFVVGVQSGRRQEASRLFALDRGSGNLLWVSADAVDTLYGVDESRVYVRGAAGEVRVLAAFDGKLLESPSPRSSVKALLPFRGRVYFVTAGFGLAAAADRPDAVLWQTQLPFNDGELEYFHATARSGHNELCQNRKTQSPLVNEVVAAAPFGWV